MERFIESHLWYCTGKYLLVLQFFACSSDKLMYKSFLVSYLGPCNCHCSFFKRSCQSNSVGTSVSIPLLYLSSSLTKQTNYFTHRWTGILTALSVDWDESSVSLSYVHIRSLCCCHTVWCMFSVGFTSAMGKIVFESLPNLLIFTIYFPKPLGQTALKLWNFFLFL